MHAIDLPPSHVIGHSMGGYIALRLAGAAPCMILRLVLVAPGGIPTDRGSSPLRYLAPLAAALRRAGPGFLPLLASDALRAGPVTLWGAAHALLAEDARLHLESVTAPTLLLWGEHDTVLPTATGRILRARIAGARLLILEGAGHVPMHERPNGFTTAVLPFLSGQPVGE